MANILFLGHEASRSGAPFTQLHLMRWMKQHTAHKMLLVLLKGGPLVAEFEQLAEVHIVDSPRFPLPARVWSKLNRMGGREHSNILNRVVAFAPDVLFASSLTAIDYAVKVKECTGAKLIVNIHELEATFYLTKWPGEFVDNLPNADWLMMGSHAVRNFYLNTYGVDPHKASVIYDFIADPSREVPVLADIRQQYGIPATAKIVGGMGSLQWRKGNDAFVYVAREVLRQSPDTYFVWVGGHKHLPDYKQMVREVKLLGMEDRVLFVGEQIDIQSYYHAFDVFLLTSREDPFPLVCLEAALARVPVICFEHSGGMPEFVRDDAGYVVPYVDTVQMAEKTLALLNNDALRRQKGTVAHDRARSSHTIGQLGPSILALIEGVLAGAPAPAAPAVAATV